MVVSLEESLGGNTLSLNVAKTQAMMIGSKQKLNGSNHPKDSSASIRINADDIRWVGNTKYIGIQIDDNLAWDYQIKPLKSKSLELWVCSSVLKRFLTTTLYVKYAGA